MTNLPILVEVATPLLALVSVAGIAWARRQDHRVRRQAAHFQGRLEIQLSALRGKEQRIRRRIGLIVELYRGGNSARRNELTQTCDDLLTNLEGLRLALHSEVIRLQQLHGRALRDAHDRIAAMANQGWDLACEFEERDQFWKKQLDSMTAAQPSAVRAPRSTRATRPAPTGQQGYQAHLA